MIHENSEEGHGEHSSSLNIVSSDRGIIPSADTQLSQVDGSSENPKLTQETSSTATPSDLSSRRARVSVQIVAVSRSATAVNGGSMVRRWLRAIPVLGPTIAVPWLPDAQLGSR
ncbi:hypothetical protein BHE74_00036362 [Ensete ventricosum]|nr:hypothetical protein GW17_00035684 [Ensete ventricosum]RWW56874.1 hypothetical protein BHE74_00036362 [Ensete ventricosum]RZS21787.1 hypothetical protein BHM03_00054460 [Ensete ventricosum]